jgi:predicted amidohydrolase YtcJ
MAPSPHNPGRRRLLGGVAAAMAVSLAHPVLARTETFPMPKTVPTLILRNGRIATLDRRRPEAVALAIADGRVLAAGSDAEIMALAGDDTRVIDLRGRRAIPGLNDSHTHLIRGGLNYNMELRWEGVPSLADALRMLREQARRTPPPQWVRVVGGWSEFQFSERRMPTLKEINDAAPDTPVFILHLYGRALLNGAALRALGIDRDSADPPGGTIERDKSGDPTGLLLATPSAFILYSTLARGPKLPLEDQINSTRHFMRELNRLGITSVIDAGGGGQNYPDDYDVIERLHRDDLLTVRIAYNLFAQKPGEELADYRRWLGMTAPGQGDAMLRMNGAGENLTWSAADFENFLEPRPTPEAAMEGQLEPITRLLVENRWPFRIHATYDETIDRFLTVFEKVNREVPFDGLRFIIDHAETITPRNIERVKALGGGIAVQHRMAFQGEYFVERYGAQAAEATPPVKRMLEMDVPVGAGTDATRVASYNPWVALYWLTEGKTLGGLALTPARNRVDRETALRLWTRGSAWFSGEQDVKGTLAPGMYADVAVLSDDYFTVPGEAIKAITSVLTIVGGEIVHGDGDFRRLAPALPPVSPDWSPVKRFGGHHPIAATTAATTANMAAAHGHACNGYGHAACGLHGHAHARAWLAPVAAGDRNAFWGALGCSCFAF